jgi:hypothetical protein
MKNENEKKGLLARLTGGKKEKKSSCCSNFRIEEIPPDTAITKGPDDLSKGKDNSCCKK